MTDDDGILAARWASMSRRCSRHTTASATIVPGTETDRGLVAFSSFRI